MSGTTLSILGLSDMYLLLVFIFIVLFIIVLPFFIWRSGFLGIFLNNLDRKRKAQAVHKNIPELKKIVLVYPAEKVGIEAKKLLEEWNKVIKPSLKTMKQEEREKKLARLYQTRIYPILEAYKQIVES